MPPKSSTVASIIACTASSSAPFTRKANESPEHIVTVSSASETSRSATQTLAPSSENTIAASRPMPPPAPVITQIFPSSLPAMSALRRDEDALNFRVAVERVHAELPSEPRLLEAAERRLHTHRRVRVHREDARVGGTGDPERASAVARPDVAR